MSTQTARQRRHTSTRMGVCQQLVAPNGVPKFVPRGSEPAGLHICADCMNAAAESDPDFDMSHCSWVGSWICRECHGASGCRDPLCDPSHI